MNYVLSQSTARSFCLMQASDDRVTLCPVSPDMHHNFQTPECACVYVQVDAATSIAQGDLTYDNARKAIFGFNQGTEGRHLLSEAVKVCCS